MVLPISSSLVTAPVWCTTVNDCRHPRNSSVTDPRRAPRAHVEIHDPDLDQTTDRGRLRGPDRRREVRNLVPGRRRGALDVAAAAPGGLDPARRRADAGPDKRER